ncbi:hypothetical protein L2D08_23220 [Domibacillus sp. PGB-M46]|uniref:hypothetical protein n=1 Tax=Domibacillus sp. PGB-M46 TaxID=2910255 RepID=UPI001F569A2A|nr:hypothetical protein [Domibacillus sp. PGB-M46]MCI2257226.1 hypothetical protein [Domibacillus sp. PGB-M46]
MRLLFWFKKRKKENLMDKELQEQLNRIMNICLAPKDQLPLYSKDRDILKKRLRVINGGKLDPK